MQPYISMHSMHSIFKTASDLCLPEGLKNGGLVDRMAGLVSAVAIALRYYGGDLLLSMLLILRRYILLMGNLSTAMIASYC